MNIISRVSLAIGFLCSGLGIYYIFNKTTKDNDVLVVGMMSGWAPFMTVNTQGEYEGFDVDVAQAIATKMGKKLHIKDLGSLAPTFIALNQGKIDMVMSGLDITQARMKTMAMIPYSGSDVRQFMLLFWEKVPAGISSINDLAAMKATVCVEPGSGQEKYLDTVKGIQEKSMSTVQDMVLDIKYGKSVAMFVEPRVAKRLQRLNKELKEVAVPLPEAYITFGCGIAIKQDNIQLITQIQDIINGLKTDGTLKKLELKWQLEEQQ